VVAEQSAQAPVETQPQPQTQPINWNETQQ
jgi:hypothetical protein